MLELMKDDLLGLTDSQLEDLVERLAEAEVVAKGGQVTDVRFGGDVKAADKGVDGRVNVNIPNFNSGFIPRANTIFQCKIPKMPGSEIKKEMLHSGVLIPAISRQIENRGAYVIVSVMDDCTEDRLNDRIGMMREVTGNNPDIIVDFIDRKKLHKWLRQHVSVMFWAREILKISLTGWRSYGHWSYVPRTVSDDFITGSGVYITMPHPNSERQSLEDGVNSVRKLILDSQKAIRIVGLSGVGKTRFVQALFDEKIGEDALDRTTVIYTDAGEEHNPSVLNMINQLEIDNRSISLVVDNCPSDTHFALTEKVNMRTNNIRLITVEYDIRDDQPERTDVFHIEAEGAEIAARLIQHRFSEISVTDAEFVAEFAGGNARIALALAENVKTERDIASLTNETLFNRLLKQRHCDDPNLRRYAEVLSLVYSFAVDANEGEVDELKILSSLCDASPSEMYDAANELLERGIAQKRGRWRAILPHAIANRLADKALNSIRATDLQNIFVAFGNDRLLMSFAHRLELLGYPASPKVEKIVKQWLDDKGILNPVLVIDDKKYQTLKYISFICPGLVLDQLEIEIIDLELTDSSDSKNLLKSKIVNLMFLLARQPEYFNQGIELMYKAYSINKNSNTENNILTLFQPDLSGTYALPREKAEVIKKFIWSSDKNKLSFGIKMLTVTLSDHAGMRVPPALFSIDQQSDGLQLSYEGLMMWRRYCLDIVVQAGLDNDRVRRKEARELLASCFTNLWFKESIRNELIEAANKLNKEQHWIEGWKAINEIIYMLYTRRDGDKEERDVPAELLKLSDDLIPQDILSKIKVYVYGGKDWEIDPNYDDSSEENEQESVKRITATVINLGEQFASSNMDIKDLGCELFMLREMFYCSDFGIGLAKGAEDKKKVWDELVTELSKVESTQYNPSVLMGYIREIAKIDKSLSFVLLDECVEHSLLRLYIVHLHPENDFSETDLDRCIRALDYPEVSTVMYGNLFRPHVFDHLPKTKIIQLAERLLEHPSGKGTLIKSLAINFSKRDNDSDILGSGLRNIAIKAIIKVLEQNNEGLVRDIGYHMEPLMRDSLSHALNDELHSLLLDTLFSGVDDNCYYFASEGLFLPIAEIITEEFLDRVFCGDEEQQRRRLWILEHGPVSRRKPYIDCVLATTDTNRLIKWCAKRDDPSIWEEIAKNIPIYASKGVDKKFQLTDESIQFLEESPYPESVLKGYHSKITPKFSWSGRRSEIMEKNLSAFRILAEHANPHISGTALKLIQIAETQISSERESEQIKEVNEEQKFE